MFDITMGGAFGAGLLSFLSPCVLPLVPFYLSYLAGVSVNQVAGGQSIDRATRLRAVFAASLFAAGVITVFVGLGISASVFGQLLRDYFDILRWAAAVVIAAMGLHFLGVFRLGFLNRTWQVDGSPLGAVSLGGAYIIGLAFAFGWTPCVGPVLAAILVTAAGSETAGQGAGLLAVYGAGMTLPFVLAAGLIGPFMALMQRMRAAMGTIERITGAALLIFAVLIATDGLSFIAFWMLETFEVFQSVG